MNDDLIKCRNKFYIKKKQQCEHMKGMRNVWMHISLKTKKIISLEKNCRSSNRFPVTI